MKSIILKRDIRETRLSLIIAGCGLLLFLAIPAASQAPAASGAPPADQALPVAKWEYTAAAINRMNAGTPEELIAILNRLGEAGWELVAVDSNIGMAIFKRPK